MTVFSSHVLVVVVEGFQSSSFQKWGSSDTPNNPPLLGFPPMFMQLKKLFWQVIGLRSLVQIGTFNEVFSSLHLQHRPLSISSLPQQKDHSNASGSERILENGFQWQLWGVHEGSRWVCLTWEKAYNTIFKKFLRNLHEFYYYCDYGFLSFLSFLFLNKNRT